MINWIEINRPFKNLGKLRRPGVLIEMDDGSIYLIGDVNEKGGRCECCGLRDEEIIKRYKVVYKK